MNTNILPTSSILFQEGNTVNSFINLNETPTVDIRPKITLEKEYFGKEVCNAKYPNRMINALCAEYLDGKTAYQALNMNPTIIAMINHTSLGFPTKEPLHL